MSVSEIIYQIDEVIRDIHKPRSAKIESLKDLAIICWNAVIPEYGTETFYQLHSDEIRDRWAEVRDEVEKYDTQDQILYVLDWPASSGNFYWVK